MSELRPKRHHYVPRMLQKRFVDSEGWLYAYSRARTDGRVYRVKPDKLFVEKHLYTEIEADGSPNVAAEIALSRIEDRVDPIIEKVVDAARQGRAPMLSRDETELWQVFMVLQWRRVPDLHLTVTPDRQLEEMLDALIRELRTSHPHLTDEIIEISTTEQRKRLMKNARIGTLASVSHDVMDAMRSRGIGIGVIREGGASLALGSRPVIKLTSPGKADIRHAECELWLPVASDVVVGLGRGEATETIVPMTRAHVRHLNLASVNQSTVFGSRSPALSTSLANPK